MSSIRKKINSVQTIVDKLGLKNLDLVADRVENLKTQDFDIIIKGLDNLQDEFKTKNNIICSSDLIKGLLKEQ